MYREIIIRAYDKDEIAQIDLSRELGINLTELVLKAIMETTLPKKRKRILKAVA